jgi:hypothetical protein
MAEIGPTSPPGRTSAQGQKRRINDANGMSGQPRIATEVMRRRNNGAGHNGKSRPLSEARELE